MATLADVFRVLADLQAAGIVANYVIGGATAVLFYAEPTRTYVVDVFVALPPGGAEDLTPLSRISEWLEARGHQPSAEHVMVYGVPVQFLPAFNELVEEAIAGAKELEYEGTAVRVIGPEHLIALALLAGGARRRERAWQLLESPGVDRIKLRALLKQHRIAADIPDADDV